MDPAAKVGDRVASLVLLTPWRQQAMIRELNSEEVYVQSQGGLGNQLFIYAFGSAVSQSRSAALVIDTWRHEIPGARPFRLRSLVAGLSTVASRHPLMTSRGPVGALSRKAYVLRAKISKSRTAIEVGSDFQPSLGTSKGTREFIGYFQSERYFESISGKLRADLRHGLANIRLPADGFSETVTRIGIHVRLGDYQSKKGQRTHGVLDSSYYEAALQIVRSKFPDAAYYFFSDTPQVARARLGPLLRPQELERSLFVAPMSDVKDLRLMSGMDGLVIANSSFSWWGAWLSDAETIIMPKRWFADGRKCSLHVRGWLAL